MLFGQEAVKYAQWCQTWNGHCQRMIRAVDHLVGERVGVYGCHAFPLGGSCFPSALSVAPVRMGRAFVAAYGSRG